MLIFIFGLFILSSHLLMYSNGQLGIDTGIKEDKEDLNCDIEITFVLYNRNNPDGVLISPRYEKEKLDSLFVKNESCVFVTHGWMRSIISDDVQVIRKGYMTKNVNIICIDWSSRAIGLLRFVVNVFPQVGRCVGMRIAALIRSGVISIDGMHIIGHSLGAHVIGVAGKTVFDIIGIQVSRATGLDPGAPYIEGVRSPGLDKGSASCVDVIHTNKGGFGYKSSLGHMDFYVNGGGPFQPGCCFIQSLNPGYTLLGIDDPRFFSWITSAACTTISPTRMELDDRNSLLYSLPTKIGEIYSFSQGICPHEMAPKYYAESLRNNYTFPSKKCSSYSNYEKGLCNSNPTEYMGYLADCRMPGDYYLTTNGSNL